MIATLYTALKNHLTSGLTQMQHITLFNNQISGSLASENKELPFARPAVLGDFSASDLVYTSGGNGVQNVDFTLRLHLVYESYNDEDLDVFTLKEKLHVAVTGFKNPVGKDLVRIAERVDTNHGNLITFQIDYRVTAQDMTVLDSKERVPVHADLQLNKDLIIDPRTNNGTRFGRF